jgi:hypothetical protein
MSERTHDNDKYTCTQERDEETVEVETGDSAFSNETHDESANDSADNTYNNIQHRSLLRICFHNERSDPADQCTEDNPA